MGTCIFTLAVHPLELEALAALAELLVALPLPLLLPLHVLYTYVPVVSARHWSMGSVDVVDEPEQLAAAYETIWRPELEHVTMAEPPLVVSRHTPWANEWPWQPLRQIESLHTYCVNVPVDEGAGVGLYGAGVGFTGLGLGVGFEPPLTFDEHGLEVIRHWFVPFCTRM